MDDLPPELSALQDEIDAANDAARGEAYAAAARWERDDATRAAFAARARAIGRACANALRGSLWACALRRGAASAGSGSLFGPNGPSKADVALLAHLIDVRVRHFGGGGPGCDQWMRRCDEEAKSL